MGTNPGRVWPGTPLRISEVSTEFLPGGSASSLLLLVEICSLRWSHVPSACQMGRLVFPVKQPIHWLPLPQPLGNLLSKGSCDCVRAARPITTLSWSHQQCKSESGWRMALISSGCCKAWCHQITRFTFSFFSSVCKMLSPTDFQQIKTRHHYKCYYLVLQLFWLQKVLRFSFVFSSSPFYFC